MADLGAMSLWIALALASYSLLGSVSGKLMAAPALVQSAQRAGYLVALALLVATLSLVGSFITQDFQVAYVAAHSDLAMPGQFTWVAFYAGNEGSLLYIAFALSVMAGVAIWKAPSHLKDSLPYTGAVLMLTLVFFLAVIAFMANPFDKLAITPLDGEGINPLLTHLGMFFHPPLLMAGLVSISIPLAFAIGSLIGGQTTDEWVDIGRQWGLVAWAMLAGGLLLGSWWAYTILGWGGFWFWDPVENAAFMPLAGSYGLRPLHHGPKTARHVPYVEHSADQRGIQPCPLRNVHEPGRPGSLGTLLWGLIPGMGVPSCSSRWARWCPLPSSCGGIHG